MSPAQANLHISAKRQKLQHPVQGSSIILDSPHLGHVARAKSAPADTMRHLSDRDDDLLHSAETTPVPIRAAGSVRDAGSPSAAPNHRFPSEAGTPGPGLGDPAAAILAEGLAGEIRDTDEESNFIPSDSDDNSSDDQYISGNEGLISSDEEDLTVPNRGQASGDSQSNAIIVSGSDDDSLAESAEYMTSDDDHQFRAAGNLHSGHDSQADPAQDLDMRMVARLNRNTFLLDTRSFCPMCRSLRHREVPIDSRKPKVQCRHSTFQLFGYHVLRPDWHENFTPAEKIIQLGHTILNCNGIRSQLVAEWNDCPHTLDEEFTDAEAQALATVMVQDQAIPSALQNLLNVVASNNGRTRNRGNGSPFIDYDDEYMLD